MPPRPTPEHLRWAIPPCAPLLYWLIDRFSFRSVRVNTPNGDWMARVGSMATLVESAGLPPAAHALEHGALVQGLLGFREVEGLEAAGELWVPASDGF